MSEMLCLHPADIRWVISAPSPHPTKETPGYSAKACCGKCKNVGPLYWSESQDRAIHAAEMNAFQYGGE